LTALTVPATGLRTSDTLLVDSSSPQASPMSTLSPTAGTVSAVNPLLEGSPETVNADPYGDGWLFELEVHEDADLDDLLDADAYAEQLSA
jgi:glycine cleavage system H protein